MDSLLQFSASHLLPPNLILKAHPISLLSLPLKDDNIVRYAGGEDIVVVSGEKVWFSKLTGLHADWIRETSSLTPQIHQEGLCLLAELPEHSPPRGLRKRHVAIARMKRSEGIDSEKSPMGTYEDKTGDMIGK